jgi:hypothetical protein
VKQSWTTIQAKFRSLCEKFRSTHGYGDAGARVNVSALPSMEDLSEMDVYRMICCIICASRLLHSLKKLMRKEKQKHRKKNRVKYY